MKRCYLIVLLFILSFTMGCTNEQNTTKDIQTCNTSIDCETPMEFLIQSNCPFTSLCIEEKCQVVCPMNFESLQAEQNKEEFPMCNTDSDCDCSWRENKSKECLCINSNCYSIE